jgi:urea transport system permease protein
VSIDHVVVVVLTALSAAATLTIATVGLAVVFGLMGVVNLAHGEFIMVGAYTTLAVTRMGVPFLIAVLVGATVTAIFGAVVELLIVRPLYGRLLDTMLATWGLSLILLQVAILQFGTVTPGVGLPQWSVTIGAYQIAIYLLLMIPTAALVIGLVYLLFTRTSYGVMARAAIQDRQMASAIGIETARLNAVTFALGCGLAGLAGGLLLPAVPATPLMGFAFVVKAFLVVVAAGPATLSGTVVTGGALASAANMSANFWSTALGDLIFFAVTIAILRLFPFGISEKWRVRL